MVARDFGDAGVSAREVFVILQRDDALQCHHGQSVLPRAPASVFGVGSAARGQRMITPLTPNGRVSSQD